jgi:Flp pilus assembly protein TadG
MRGLPILSALRRDERGVSVIELGFLAPILALLATGVIDLSKGLSERFTIQQAVNRSLELVQARPAVADENDNEVSYEFVRTEALKAAGTGAQVTLTLWRECDGVTKTPYADSCAEGEDQARYLRVRITKNYAGQFYFSSIPLVASGAMRIQ